MDAAKNGDDHMTSAAAFVDGGVQEACDDACSICLEDFSQSDPSTVTNCKHEFHLQCILEWCQRSSNCPMCWQPISLKDATSQELLEAVEQERIAKSNRSRNPTVFHHPTLRDFDLHLPLGGGISDLEEQIFQHLAAAAAMRRGNRYFRREGQRNMSSSQAHHPFFIFEEPSTSSVGGSASMLHPNRPYAQELPVAAAQADQLSVSRTGSSDAMGNRQSTLLETRSFSGQSSLASQDTAGPSDLQSLSESLRSRFSAWSTRYKESISRNTRGWKERLFARSTSMADIGSEVRREVNSGIASVSRMMERLDSRENNGDDSRSSDAASRSTLNDSENHATHVSDGQMSAPCATSSTSD